MEAFILSNKMIVYHTVEHINSTKYTESQLKHALCAKYFLAISKTFIERIDDFRKSDGFNPLFTDSASFREQYINFEFWDITLDNKGYYNYFTEDSIIKLFSHPKQVQNKKFMMNKLKLISMNSDEFEIIKSFKDNPQEVLDLYYSREKWVEKETSLKLFYITYPTYDKYCAPDISFDSIEPSFNLNDL